MFIYLPFPSNVKSSCIKKQKACQICTNSVQIKLCLSHYKYMRHCSQCSIYIPINDDRLDQSERWTSPLCTLCKVILLPDFDVLSYQILLLMTIHKIFAFLLFQYLKVDLVLFLMSFMSTRK